MNHIFLDSLLWNTQTKKITFIKLFQCALIPKAEKYGRYTKKIKSPRAKYFYKSHLKNRTSTNQLDLAHYSAGEIWLCIAMSIALFK